MVVVVTALKHKKHVLVERLPVHYMNRLVYAASMPAAMSPCFPPQASRYFSSGTSACIPGSERSYRDRLQRDDHLYGDLQRKDIRSSRGPWR